MTKLEKANIYIKENIQNIQNRPTYHFTPQIGWLNDPNGFCEYNGSYHLFYQYYPYDVKWGDMHWGHAISKDLVVWEYKDIALANDTIPDANGCFSGSSIEKDGKLFLMYTGHIEPNIGLQYVPEQIIQHQCLAESKNGIDFVKYENNPVISINQLPKNYKKSDFRDPKVWEHNGIYYAVHAVKNIDDRGEIILYKSIDLIKWKFVNSLFKTKFEENKMLECPDFFHLDGKDVLIYSGMPCSAEFQGKVQNTIEYHIGKLNYNTGEYISEIKGFLDYGDSYYAPQTTEDTRGRRLLVAWMKKWTNSYNQVPSNFKWNGMMTIIRELKIINNKLVQLPINEIKKYTKSIMKIENKKIENDYIILNKALSPQIISFSITNCKEQLSMDIFDDTKINMDKNKFEYISSFYNKKENILLEELLINADGKIKIDIYIDLYSLEIIINNGENSFTYTNFNGDKKIKLKLKSNQNFLIEHLEIFDFIV